MPLYFAYGELLDSDTLRSRLGPAAGDVVPTPIAPAKLTEHKLVFRKLIAGDTRAFADLAPDSDATVYGALFNLTDAQVTALDRLQAPQVQQVAPQVPPQAAQAPQAPPQAQQVPQAPPAPPAPYQSQKVEVTPYLPQRGSIQVDGVVVRHEQEVTASLHKAVSESAEPAQPTRQQMRTILDGALASGLPLPWSRSLISSFGQMFCVDDIVVGNSNSAGEPIAKVHIKAPPLYAVYETDTVRVQYADDIERADQQRKSMAELNELRGQIGGLINGWQTARWRRLRIWARWLRALLRDAGHNDPKPDGGVKKDNDPKPDGRVKKDNDAKPDGRVKKDNDAKPDGRVKKYNTRVAAGLIMCLEGDAKGARSTLQGVHDDILADRQSLGRYQYLIAAFLTSAAIVGLFYLFRHAHWNQFYRFPGDTAQLMLAARAGAVGAFFSVAMGLTGRTIKTDLHPSDNRLDAALRIVIGTIAGAVLVLLLQTKFVGVLTTAGGQTGAITAASGQLGLIDDWKTILVVGFVAGFLERLVPDLLEKSK